MRERTFAFVPCERSSPVRRFSEGKVRRRGAGPKATALNYVPRSVGFLTQYSGVCFLNKHPCGVMPATSLMTTAF